MANDGNEHSLGDLLGAFKSNPRYKSQLIRKKIEELWLEMMGNWVSTETESIRLDGRRLILTITSSALRQELHLSRDRIRDRVNEVLGEEYVQEVYVR